MKKFSRPILFVAFTLLFLIAAILGGPANPFDRLIITQTAEWRNAWPEFTKFVLAFTDIGGARITLGITGLAVVTLLIRRLPRTALLLALTVPGERQLVEVLKDWIGRPRPALEPLWMMPQSLAYPSGHAANSMTAFVAVALLATSVRWRWSVGVAAIVIALLVGLSRIFLGVHWPSDVIGGWALGLIAIGVALEIGERSGALPLEPKHDVIGGHLPPSTEREAS